MKKSLESMKETLMCCVQGQMGNLSNVDTQELGAAIDMIKDLEEAIYYCTITEAMKEKENGNGNGKEQHHHYYTTPMYYPYSDRDMDRGYGRMYYPEKNSTDGRDSGRRNYEDNMYYPDRMYYNGGGSSSGGGNSFGGGSQGGSGGSSSGGGSSRSYTEREFSMMRDPREGRSSQSRRSYMETKEMHKDKAHQLKELEKYMQELTQDMVEMIEDASPEEKQYLEKRITALGNKIGQLNG